MLCIKCKYTDHAAHLCSDLTTAAAAHRRKLEECAQVTRARVQEMQTVLLEGERVSLRSACAVTREQETGTQPQLSHLEVHS